MRKRGNTYTTESNAEAAAVGAGCLGIGCIWAVVLIVKFIIIVGIALVFTDLMGLTDVYDFIS